MYTPNPRQKSHLLGSFRKPMFLKQQTFTLQDWALAGRTFLVPPECLQLHWCSAEGQAYFFVALWFPVIPLISLKTPPIIPQELNPHYIGCDVIMTPHPTNKHTDLLFMFYTGCCPVWAVWLLQSASQDDRTASWLPEVLVKLRSVPCAYVLLADASQCHGGDQFLLWVPRAEAAKILNRSYHRSVRGHELLQSQRIGLELLYV